MKTIIVGVNHAGTSAARILRALDKDMEIVAYDRNDNISFLGCGIALWVSDVIKDPNGLFYATPEILRELDIEINIKHDVIESDLANKKIKIKNLDSGEIFEDTFDKIIFATGSWPIVPAFEGVDLKGIHLCKLFQHAGDIIENLKNPNVKNAVIVGAGYIGIELAEAFHLNKRNTTLIDMVDRCIPNYFDSEFTDELHEVMKKDGIKLALGEKVLRFEGENGQVKKVITDKGEYDADIVILAIGFKPNTDLIADQVETIQNRSIKVSNKMETSIKDVYAIGDSVALYDNSVGEHRNLALASNAVKTGIAAAYAVAGVKLDFPGITGTNGICVFDQKLASTGLSEEVARRFGFNVASAITIDNERPDFMPTNNTVMFKIVYDKDSRRIIGAQVKSSGDSNHSESMFMISLAIEKQMTVDELALSDMYFLPHYNKPFNYILSTLLKTLV